jgi:1,4-dihydroxy-2-naphthoate polyprenyltransferase
MTNITKIHSQSLSAWVLAIRPKTLMAGIIPVLVGSLMTFRYLSELEWGIVFCALIVAVSIQIATNLFNDAIDFKKGSDTHERLGPTRVTQSGLLSQQQVIAAAVAFLLIATLFVYPLVLKGGIYIALLFFSALIFSYAYTGGPFPLSYIGLGEVFVILYYGFVATMISYYLQAGFLSWDSVILSLQMGLLITNLLAINNLRDIAEDSKTGKRTLAARFGALFGRWEITLFTTLPFVLNFYWYLNGRFFVFLLPFTTLLIAINLIRGIWNHSPSRIYNRFLGESSMLLAFFGLMQILGMRMA